MYFKIIEKIGELLKKSENTFKSDLVGKRAFKNSSKLPLCVVILLLISPLNRSLQLELFDCYTRREELSSLPSKSSFSQSRKKIKSSLFEHFNEHLLKLLKELDTGTSPPSKLNRVAVDGSNVDLPQTKELKKAFGQVKNQHKKGRTQGRCCVAYDIDKDLIIRSELDSCKTSEKAISLNLLDHFDSKNLLIYDQYYFGYGFCYRHFDKGIHFLMRVHRTKNNVIKDFVDSGKRDEIVEITMTDKAYKDLIASGHKVDRSDTLTIRLVRGSNDDGEDVFYATDLLDKQEFSLDFLNESYKGRWKVETAIDVLKNKIQLECFAGHTELAVYQEFHSATCFYNLVSVLYNQANQKLIEEQSKKQQFDEKTTEEQINKQYQVNRNLAIGLLNSCLFTIFLNENTNKAQTNWEEIINILVRFPEPVRPGRKYEIKYSINKRKGRYYTQTNYRRAA